MVVRSTAGAESEAQLAFAGLHRLMQPFLGHLAGLPRPQRLALETAFGIAEGNPPDAFIMGVATLGLIADAAGEAPVLLVADDAHWLDRPSCEALVFAGRRLELEPVLLLLALRETVTAGSGGLGLPEMRPGGLDDSAARALLRETASALSGDVQERILREAAGNPLALIELPEASAGFKDRPGIKPLPLTARLETAFASRLADVKEDTRVLLLLAALDEAPIVTHLRAAEALLGRAVEMTALEPAVAAGLGRIADERFEFRHPLVRSAVQQAVTAQERRRAHSALARELADTDRSVWHEAAAATRPDEGVAARLERSAERALQRGGAGIAISALERAATLSADTAAQGRRLTRAATLSFDAGDAQAGHQLLGEAFRLDLPAAQRTRIAFMLEVLRSTNWSGVEGVRAYLRAVRGLVESADYNEAMFALTWGALRAHWSNLDEGTRGEIVAVAERLHDRRRDSGFLRTIALIDPVGHGSEVLARIRHRAPVAEEDPFALLDLGIAAATIWSADLALPFLHAAVNAFRAHGSPAVVAQALTFAAWDEVRMGNARAAITAADEARRLSADTAQPLYVASASVAEVIARSEHGADPGAEQRLAEAEGMFLAVGASPMVALVHVARGRLALTGERYGEAYLRLSRVFDPNDAAYHQYAGGWVLADLADAALHGDGDLAHVAAVSANWTRIADATQATHLRVQLRYVAALLAGESEAGDRFQELIVSSASGWPFYLARAQLAYGGWLRRRRRAAQARQPLREAVETFDALGQAALAERARRELRASGQTMPRRAAEAWDELSPQELQIARLAAAGLPTGR